MKKYTNFLNENTNVEPEQTQIEITQDQALMMLGYSINCVLDKFNVPKQELKVEVGKQYLYSDPKDKNRMKTVTVVEIGKEGSELAQGMVKVKGDDIKQPYPVSIKNLKPQEKVETTQQPQSQAKPQAQSQPQAQKPKSYQFNGENVTIVDANEDNFGKITIKTPDGKAIKVKKSELKEI